MVSGMKKSEIRKSVIPALSEYVKSPAGRANAQDLYQQLFESDDFKQSSTVGVTLNMEDELDTQPIIDKLNNLNKRVVVPRTLPDFQMEFVVLDERTRLERTKFGVREPVGGQVVDPSGVDLLIVPGVAFTPLGERVGFGAGFYDRYLKKFSGRTITLALKPQFFDKADWVVDDYDVLVQQVFH